MKCEDVEALMIDYLDNNLDDNSKREIEKHLETCERCLDELRDSQEVIRMISKDDMVNPDDTLRINFLPYASQRDQKKQTTKCRNISRKNCSMV